MDRSRDRSRLGSLVIGGGELVTRQRVRAYGLIFLVAVVAEYLFASLTGSGLLDRFGQVKGTDFIQFYVAGQLIAAGHGAELYRFVPPFQFPVQFAAEARVLAPQMAHPNFAYVVPPFFALLFVPLARLPYLWAYLTWCLFNVGLLLAALRLLRPHVGVLRGKDRWLVYLVAASFFPFLECLFDGQNGVVSFFLLTLVYIALRRQREVLAGVALAAVLYKPQLVITLAFALLIARRWRVLAGLVGGGVALVGISWLIVGTDGMRDYLALSTTMPGWIYLPGWRVWNMHSWQSFFVLLFPDPLASHALTVLFSAATLGVVAVIWRPGSTVPLDLRFALALIGTVLVSPHVFAYDLTLLILPGLLLADALILSPGQPVGTEWQGTVNRIDFSHPVPDGVSIHALRLCLALTYLAPLFSRFLALGLHFQVSVPIIAAFFVVTAFAVSNNRGIWQRGALPDTPIVSFSK